MAGKRYVKQVIRVFESEGLTVSDHIKNRNHNSVTITNDNGKSTRYFFAVSPSDFRAIRKLKSDARRFAKHGFIKRRSNE